MSSPTQCIISELEHEFTEQPSIRNSVQTSEGEIVRLDEAIWIASPVLRDHRVNGNSYKALNASKTCLKTLCKMYKYGNHISSDFTNSLNLLAVASELELQSLTSDCFDDLYCLEAFYKSDYPSECSIETVLRCFTVFLNSPLRIVEIYKDQLNRIARHCSNNRDVMLNAINLVKQTLEKYMHSSLEGIPVGFNRRMVPIVIFKRGGKRQSAIIKRNKLRPVNLFGEHLNLDAVEVEDLFYLKYGLYLLYKSGEFVYYKNLRDDSDPVEQLNGCTIFVTRGNFTFAVRSEDRCDSILMWTNDEKFVKIFESPREIQMLEFERDTRLLAVRVDGIKLLLFRLEHNTLSLLHESCVPGLKNVLLSEEDMFYIMKDDGELTVQTHHVPSDDDDDDGDDDYYYYEDDDDDDDEADDDTSRDSDTPIKIWGPSTEAHDIGISCGTYYLLEDRRLDILPNFPSRDGRWPLLTKGELCSISELWLLS